MPTRREPPSASVPALPEGFIPLPSGRYIVVRSVPYADAGAVVYIDHELEATPVVVAHRYGPELLPEVVRHASCLRPFAKVADPEERRRRIRLVG